jgi:GT2 family glycosyltransferase
MALTGHSRRVGQQSKKKSSEGATLDRLRAHFERWLSRLLNRKLDFLIMPLSGDEVIRGDGKFHIRKPWAVARFHSISLSRGWWSFDADGDLDDLEIRIRDDSGLIFSCRPATMANMLLFVGVSTTADVDFVLSPWPGHVAFRKLRLRRLNLFETSSFFVRRAVALFRSDRPIARGLSSIGLLLSRRNFGALSGLEKAKEREKLVERFSVDPGETDYQLDRRTLNLIKQTFLDHPTAVAIYGDAIEGGSLSPSPEWDEERAHWFRFVRGPVFFSDGTQLEGDAAWDRLLVIASNYGQGSILRIPLPLAIRESCESYPLLTPPPPPQLDRMPLVTVIIPTKHRTDLLNSCLEGLVTHTDYPNFEVVVVNNGSSDPRLSDVLTSASTKLSLKVVDDPREFNFSRLINLGAKHAVGEVLLSLNDDVRPLEKTWMHRMVAAAIDPAVGAVGARLLYPSGDIQHAGVAMGLGGVCGHLWRHLSVDMAQRNPHIVFPGRRLAVTGACLAVRRSTFESIGGLDEANYPVTLNDIDFCLRLRRKGLVTIYRGDAVLLHEESQSRGDDQADLEKYTRRCREIAVFRRQWRAEIDYDPYSSPAFDLATEAGAVTIPVPVLPS